MHTSAFHSARTGTAQRPLRGFTLIEILVVMGMIAILASVVLVAINPLRQFAEARNSQRVSNVNAILNAVGNRLAENKGVFTDSTTPDCPTLPNSPLTMGNGTSMYDIRPCLSPVYISDLPYDPIAPAHNTCTTNTCDGTDESYDTEYTITQTPDNRVTVCAPQYAESALDISTAYCLTR